MRGLTEAGPGAGRAVATMYGVAIWMRAMTGRAMGVPSGGSASTGAPPWYSSGTTPWAEACGIAKERDHAVGAPSTLASMSAAEPGDAPRALVHSLWSPAR